jgi:guanyl-specific ribonuclease Sa
MRLAEPDRGGPNGGFMMKHMVTLLALAGSFLLGSGLACDAQVPARKSAPPAEVTLPDGVPAKVAKVLRHIDETGRAPEGYEGGRKFLNVEKLLPEKDAEGRRITYHEWDVNPHRPGVNRGPERLVTGSDGRAYYTGDHYRSFKKIR